MIDHTHDGALNTSELARVQWDGGGAPAACSSCGRLWWLALGSGLPQPDIYTCDCGASLRDTARPCCLACALAIDPNREGGRFPPNKA